MNIVDRRAEHLATKMGDSKPQNSNSHNPIVNPLAWVNQNPAIRKEMEKNQFRHIQNDYSQSPSAVNYSLPKIEIQHNKSVDYGNHLPINYKSDRNDNFA